MNEHTLVLTHHPSPAKRGQGKPHSMNISSFRFSRAENLA